MVVLDKGNSNGNALVTAEVETYLEGGVAKTANLDSSNKNLKSNVQVSHVWEIYIRRNITMKNQQKMQNMTLQEWLLLVDFK